MNISKLIFFGLTIVVISSCTKSIDLSTKMDNFIKKDSTVYEALTNAYEFKFYEDGVGMDVTKPIFNDSIIFLEDNISELFDLKKINNGKCILMDSSEICKMSYEHDKNRQVMRSFMKVLLNEGSKGLTIEIKNWVPQYNDDKYICIELENEVYTVE